MVVAVGSIPKGVATVALVGVINNVLGAIMDCVHDCT